MPEAHGLGLSREHPGAGRALRLLRGTPKSFIKTAESGTKRRHAFCGDCGTPIYACAIENPPTYSLRVGTITQREAFSPKRQIWRRSALPWLAKIAAAPVSEKG